MISINTMQIKNSKIRDMYNLALQFDHPINLTIGEPDFSVSEHVAAGACKAILEGKTKYTENAGVFLLREKISQYLKRETGLDYSPEKEITVTTGAMGGLFQIFKTILDPGDEVIVNEPCWTNYIQQIRMCEGVPVSVSTRPENGFSIDLEAIADVITDKTKAIVLNSPCNPTGNMIAPEELETLAHIIKDTGVLVISDEVYKHIIFGETEHKSIAAFPGMQERTLIVDSFSKSHAMTGFRVGYVAGPEPLISNITKLQENITACAAMPSQFAAIAALEDSTEHLDNMVRAYRERRDHLMELLNACPYLSCYPPKGTFYAFVDVRATGMDSETFAVRLLQEKQVVVVPGTAFGETGEGHIRLSFATSMDQLRIGMERITDFVMHR